MTLHRDRPKKPWYRRIVDISPIDKPEKRGSNPVIITAIVVVAVLLIAAMITWGVIAGVKFF